MRMCDGQQVWAWHSGDKEWQLGFVVDAWRIKRRAIDNRLFVFFIQNNTIRLVKNACVEDFGRAFRERYVMMLEKNKDKPKDTQAAVLTMLNAYLQINLEIQGLNVEQFLKVNQVELENHPDYWISYYLSEEGQQYRNPTCVGEEFIREHLARVPQDQIPTDTSTSPSQPLMEQQASGSDDWLKIGQYVWFESKLSDRYVPAVVLHREGDTVFVTVLLDDKCVEYAPSSRMEDLCSNFVKHCGYRHTQSKELLDHMALVCQEIRDSRSIDLPENTSWHTWSKNHLHKFKGACMGPNLFSTLKGKSDKKLQQKLDRFKHEPTVTAYAPPPQPMRIEQQKPQPIRKEHHSRAPISAQSTKSQPISTVQTKSSPTCTEPMRNEAISSRPISEHPTPQPPISAKQEVTAAKPKLPTARKSVKPVVRKPPKIENTVPSVKSNSGANVQLTPKQEKPSVKSNSTPKPRKRTSGALIQADLCEPMDRGFRREIVMRKPGSAKLGDVYYHPPDGFDKAPTKFFKLRSGNDVRTFLEKYGNRPTMIGLTVQENFNFNCEIKTEHPSEEIKQAGEQGRRRS